MKKNMDGARPDVLVAEIGSTTTVVSAFEGIETGQPSLVGQVTVETTVDQGDARLGLNEAIRALGPMAQGLPLMACSSAAGGLVMSVHGLVYDMTVKAAREAALGAGAIVKMVTAGLLSRWDLEEVSRLSPGIILLAGGVEHGDRNTVVANARALAAVHARIPVVFAGNSSARQEVVDILRSQGRRVETAENVYPAIDQLDVEPARMVIQRVFEERITEAPGMARIRQGLSGVLLPTPGAVMEASTLLYRELGDLMTIDVGGATTDVHSITEGSEELRRISTFPEPFRKRTVEGDLGVRRNAVHIVNIIGEEDLSKDLGLDAREVLASMHTMPSTPLEERLVARLAKEAVGLAVARHAGRLKEVYGPGGRSVVAEGRDLGRVEWIVGTGGPLTRLPGGKEALEALTVPGPGREMYPRDARVLLDGNYVMAACGVLSTRWPKAAASLLCESTGVHRGV
ncbi:MAG: glutamate mutase L [Bacillota bacterium]